MKCYLKTENNCMKIRTKHLLNSLKNIIKFYYFLSYYLINACIYSLFLLIYCVPLFQSAVHTHQLKSTST